MGKFILTEQEKLRIKTLYENLTPPNEYEIVGYVNPFRDQKYLPYAHTKYSKELKDGDLFYDLQNIDYFSYNLGKYEKCLTDFIKPITSNLSDLIGKTVRVEDDKIQKISKIDIRLGVLVGARNLRTELLLGSIKTPQELIPYKIYILDENNELIEKENLTQTIEKKLPKIMAKDLPDCLFELKKVKRILTDFKP